MFAQTHTCTNVQSTENECMYTHKRTYRQKRRRHRKLLRRLLPPQRRSLSMCVSAHVSCMCAHPHVAKVSVLHSLTSLAHVFVWKSIMISSSQAQEEAAAKKAAEAAAAKKKVSCMLCAPACTHVCTWPHASWPNFQCSFASGSVSSEAQEFDVDCLAPL